MGMTLALGENPSIVSETAHNHKLMCICLTMKQTHCRNIESIHDGHCLFITCEYNHSGSFRISEGQASFKLAQFTIFALSANIKWWHIQRNQTTVS